MKFSPWQLLFVWLGSPFIKSFKVEPLGSLAVGLEITSEKCRHPKYRSNYWCHVIFISLSSVLVIKNDPIENYFSKSMITFETFKFKYFLKSSKILNFSSFSIIWSGWTFSNFQPSFSILIFERFFFEPVFEPLSLWVEINSGRLSLTTHLLPFVFSQFFKFERPKISIQRIQRTNWTN